jgi:hypothetical protein
MRPLGLVIVLIGLLLTTQSAVAALQASDVATCREKTQYDTTTGNIVECNDNLCIPTTPACERDDTTYPDPETGAEVTIVFCSCGPIDGSDIFSVETCHIYRYHVAALTEPRCTSDNFCTGNMDCDIADPMLTVQTCECK